ncbi:NAD-dependent epimerase/dehydratase family protein [Paenibacillus sp. LMG 31461]|uniref:NAD-dependent epimerase/dehydratase family protein n=1 Tax=Paenibacillus plantarum TaxID=2654975 RepID=A0ABX1XCN3_9BACL|nr:NAD-dependent epimerase/dehydratase family protein [Paenibacillus plantarum]NOU66240.1 NAD-dependent epimerase/dehydratase family protein [Paenibacillus plantarum]
MRVVVTGGCGFIGSHIVERLIKEKHEVLVIDNLSTGKIENINLNEVIFHQIDILDQNLNDIFHQFKPRIVYHLAAQIDIQKSMKDPKFDADSNIKGTISLLECCRNVGVRKIIYASSAAIYGNPLYLPIDEKHSKIPLSFYGLSKFTPESYIKLFSELHDLKYTILRYANVYGERQDYKGEGGVVSIFLNKILKNEAPYINGDGEQSRDFIYVKDIAEANLAVMDAGDNEIYNISTNIPTKINTLYQNIILSCARTHIMPIYKESRKGDILDSYLDNQKIKTHLGWEPKYTLIDGIKETLRNQRSNNLL